jgi:hypothetical protein
VSHAGSRVFYHHLAWLHQLAKAVIHALPNIGEVNGDRMIFNVAVPPLFPTRTGVPLHSGSSEVHGSIGIQGNEGWRSAAPWLGRVFAGWEARRFHIACRFDAGCVYNCIKAFPCDCKQSGTVPRVTNGKSSVWLTLARGARIAMS